MAVEGEEVEYESDPEDAMLLSVLRRREASDDEDGERSEEGRKPVRKDRIGIGSDGESDGQGGAPGYEDEEDFEEEEEIDEEEVEEEVQGREVEADVEEVEEIEGEGERLEDVVPSLESPKDGRRSGGDGNEEEEEGEQEEEEKKENEPYAVPTAGAFYMHDDRFQENGRGRHRRMPGGRRLWESKDDRAWVHDRFEEMNLQDSRYDEGRRNPRGRFRGRGGGKTRGAVRGGYVRGNRSRAYYDDGNNQNRVPKTVRGRGPRRYEPLPKNNEVSSSQHKQYAKPHEFTANTSTGRPATQSPTVQPDPVLPRKHVFASSLNSASPPFYPSGSSSQDTSLTQKRNSQNGSSNKNISSSMHMENNFLSSQSGSLLRGKPMVDSLDHDRLYMDDSLRSVAGKSFVGGQSQSLGSSLASINTNQFSHSRVQGRSSTVAGPSNCPPASSLGQTSRTSAQLHPPIQPRPLQPQLQPALRISTQQLGQRPVSASQVSSPPQAPSTNSSEVGDGDSPPGSSKSKTQLVGKGKTSNQGTGRGSFLYGGAQVIGASGAMGLTHNDQNFSGTPALLPVMQFGGQHHGGLGVPAVGMALPGYVAQPQLGFGNSEMTWVPVLAGAAGALGASYCPPYIALDSSYYPRPTGQTSSSVTSSRETGAAKPANALKSAQRPEIVNDEFGQRQNKPRRYSEMSFGQ